MFNCKVISLNIMYKCNEIAMHYLSCLMLDIDISYFFQSSSCMNKKGEITDHQLSVERAIPSCWAFVLQAIQCLPLVYEAWLNGIWILPGSFNLYSPFKCNSNHFLCLLLIRTFANVKHWQFCIFWKDISRNLSCLALPWGCSTIGTACFCLRWKKLNTHTHLPIPHCSAGETHYKG